MSRISETATERDLNDVFEIQLNFIRCQRIGESIERLLQLGFKIFDNGNYFFNSRLVDHTTRSIDEQRNVLVKLNFRWELHFVLFLRCEPCVRARPRIPILGLTSSKWLVRNACPHAKDDMPLSGYPSPTKKVNKT